VAVTNRDKPGDIALELSIFKSEKNTNFQNGVVRERGFDHSLSSDIHLYSYVCLSIPQYPPLLSNIPDYSHLSTSIYLYPFSSPDIHSNPYTIVIN
jgi:hypothetical protein